MVHRIRISMMDVPIGIDDFKETREKGLYFADKTSLIVGIVSRPGTKVFLFTRPRRFGKSLGLSIIDVFFSIGRKGSDWFDGLRVMSDARCVGMMGSFPVVSISLKRLGTDSYDMMLSDFKRKMEDVS